MTLRKMQVEEATSSPYRVPEAFDRFSKRALEI